MMTLVFQSSQIPTQFFVLGMMLAAIMVNYASVTALTAVVDYPKGFLVPYSPGCFKKGLGASPQRRH